MDIEREISVKFKVFNDPEYCFAHNGKCKYFYKQDLEIQDSAWCRFFPGNAGGYTSLECHKMQNTWIKCAECKEAFQESSNIQNSPI